MSQNRMQLPPFLSSWKSLVGLFLIVIALVLFITHQFTAFQALIIAALGVILI